MSEEQLKAFLEKVKVDTSLQEKLKAAADANTVVEIAKEAGFSFSADKITKSHSEISEEELEALAGGISPIFQATRPPGWEEWINLVSTKYN